MGKIWKSGKNSKHTANATARKVSVVLVVALAALAFLATPAVAVVSTVGADGSSYCTVNPVPPGAYAFEATGTYVYGYDENGDPRLGDASTGLGSNAAEMTMVPVDETLTHSYAGVLVFGTSLEPLCFFIDDSWYADNEGGLLVTTSAGPLLPV